MGMGDNIVINEFMFCRDRGKDYCHYCACDHCEGNGIRVEDELMDELVDGLDSTEAIFKLHSPMTQYSNISHYIGKIFPQRIRRWRPTSQRQRR